MRCYNVIGLLLLSFGLLFNSSWAQDKPVKEFPVGCKPLDYQFQDNLVVLGHSSKQIKQRIYLLKNNTKSVIWINHPNKHPSVSAGWTSQLAPGHWSSIAIKEADFALECVEIKPGSEQYLPCKSVLKVCLFPYASFDTTNVGTFWVAEDKPLPEILNEIKARGIRVI